GNGRGRGHRPRRARACRQTATAASAPGGAPHAAVRQRRADRRGGGRGAGLAGGRGAHPGPRPPARPGGAGPPPSAWRGGEGAGGGRGGVRQLGFPPFSFLLVLGVAGAFLAARRPMEAGILTAAAAGSAVLASGFQSLHARPRPEAGVLRVTSELPYYSFPSGHTIMYVAFFGFLAYLGYTRLRPGRLRTLLLAALGALIALVGPSRVYLGHHWPSDVLAAYALGLVYLVVLVRLYARQQLARVPAQPLAV